MLENFFFSIGGGDEIGASCYYLYCNGKHFLFDAGIRYEKKRRYPSFSELLKLSNFDTFNDINGFFLSHAHYDHNGALPLLVSKLPYKKEIICTEYTKVFTELQLNILKKHTGIEKYSIYEEILVDKAIGMLSDYPFNKRMDKQGYSFTFYPSGHILGASMILLETEDKKVLYTGDFSDIDYPLVEKYQLPNLSDIDLLIINSTNVFKKTKSLENKWEDSYSIQNDIFKEVVLYNQVNLEINQVNSGMELVTLLQNLLKNTSFQYLKVKVYVDEPINNMINIIKEKENIEFPNIYLIDENLKFTDEKIIFITIKKNQLLEKIKKLHLDYSLHETYSGIKDLILKINAKKTLITHYKPSENKKEILLKDLEKKGYFNCEYVENEEIYEF